ncbi:hypothetical protein OB236_32325 [Paenibacillus sp. WQ 127069]|uniref:ATPase dynein-related AAA domain-containing protein n=1 Tax=Paenibacillus baimaensis TaxID=2982185 RepID=A0ABT2UQJ9_9BACL|nr:hypothetical protein [Paenibacillus sp. WQ 127069]MCU6796822.1 hypothetical protein [Paenibacillus sp. WQ 127069]
MVIDYEVAQAMYNAILQETYNNFKLQLGSTSILVAFDEIIEDEEGTFWLNFILSFDHDGEEYIHYFSLRLGPWSHNGLSNGISYYMNGFIGNSVHHEVSLQKVLTEHRLQQKLITIKSTVIFASRDNGNEERKKHALAVLRLLGMNTDERMVEAGVWDVESGGFIDGTEEFVKCMILITLVKAHYRINSSLEIPGILDMKIADYDEELQIVKDDDNQLSSFFIHQFHEFVRSRGFFFDKELLIRFVLSLKSKPFLILSGISGTGKTKIAQLFVEFSSVGRHLSTPPNDLFTYILYPYNFTYQRMIVPVRLAEQLNLDGLDQGVEITLRFGENSESALIKRESQGHIRLGFRKAFMVWLSGNFSIGDSLFISVEGKGESIQFYKEMPGSQVNSVCQHAFMSVRPDWLDHTALLGFYNPILQMYHSTDLLKLMLRAHQNRDLPFFLILDEMNLSKVEYYFADFLSCIESRRVGRTGELQQEKIPLHEEWQEEIVITDEDGTIYQVPNRIEIPGNLYIIGTINVDETTYMFSPKVLDRAHVIECNEMDLDGYIRIDMRRAFNQNASTASLREIEWFTSDSRYHLDLYKKTFLNPEHRLLLDDLFDAVEGIHSLLLQNGISFGYRVVDELFYFILNAYSNNLLDGTDSLDIGVLQKVLPKLHGNRAQMEQVLADLFKWTEPAEGISLETDMHALTGIYPRTMRKMQTMHRQLSRTGYCSFIQ